MSFLRLIAFFCVVFLSLTNCGSGGDDSSPGDIIVNGDVVDCVDSATLTNGANLYSIDSYWYCYASDTYSMSAFYDDGTWETMKSDGTNYRVGTWYESDCNEIFTTNANGTSRITIMAGSLDSGIFTFRDLNDDGTSTNASCVLEYL